MAADGCSGQIRASDVSGDESVESVESGDGAPEGGGAPDGGAGAHRSASPLNDLQVIAAQQVSVTPDLEHVELFTLGGLLTILWHGDPQADRVVLAVGGAMGGLLGPADGLYHD